MPTTIHLKAPISQLKNDENNENKKFICKTFQADCSSSDYKFAARMAPTWDLKHTKKERGEDNIPEEHSLLAALYK